MNTDMDFCFKQKKYKDLRREIQNCCILTFCDRNGIILLICSLIMTLETGKESGGRQKVSERLKRSHFPNQVGWGTWLGGLGELPKLIFGQS